MPELMCQPMVGGRYSSKLKRSVVIISGRWDADHSENGVQATHAHVPISVLLYQYTVDNCILNGPNRILWNKNSISEFRGTTTDLSLWISFEGFAIRNHLHILRQAVVSLPNFSNSSAMISALIALEKPLAYLGLTSAVTTVVWKTVGLGFIPGFDAIWGGPRYPRRHGSEWDLFYLIMYGGIGVVGQWAGLEISTDASNRVTNQKTLRRAKMLGFFHVVIGTHHVMWALFKNWGRLNLDRFNIPHGNLLGGLGFAITAYHGLKLLTASESYPFEQIVRHKSLVDASSLLSLIPMVAFLPAQWIGYNNFKFEQWTWIAVLTVPLTMFAADFASAAMIERKKSKRD